MSEEGRREVGERLAVWRERAGMSQPAVEDALGIGAGWMQLFESGEVPVHLDVLLPLLKVLGVSAGQFFAGFGEGSTGTSALFRYLRADEVDGGLDVHFPYGGAQATYRLPNAASQDLTEILSTLRVGLAGGATSANDAAVLSNAVARTFLRAVSAWPHVNPSDLWYFVVYRAYLDVFNHPASHVGLDLSQSWKRTGGWALEKVLVSHYGPLLAANGITLSIRTKHEVELLLGGLDIADRMEADKVDVVITANNGKAEEFLGVVHVKASFAERRTDDVPMSRVLVQAGYFSPLWTMDCKATPGSVPTNRGELGAVLGDSGRDNRSAKRKDIEEDGFFSACFSYNTNTAPTPPRQGSATPIVVCDFSNPDDAFSRAVLEHAARRR